MSLPMYLRTASQLSKSTYLGIMACAWLSGYLFSEAILTSLWFVDHVLDGF